MNTNQRSGANRFGPCLLCCLLAALILVDSARAQFDKLYAFGDSLSDLGNTYNALGGSANDAEIYNLIDYTASPGRYDDGRWSNGPLWVEHVNDRLGLPTLARNDGTQPLTTGTDFAFGGATSGTGYTDVIVANLQTQVANYVTLSGGSGSPTGLYTVWAGGNDVINYIADKMPNTPAGIEQLAEKMATNIATAVTTLYDAGGRHFLVANLPALGDKPDYVDTPNQAFANDIVTTYNPLLAQHITDLEVQLPEITLYAWDAYTEFNQILDNAGTYGFTDVKDASFSSAGPYPGTVVANPDEHVFWDHTHPTAPGHMLLGQFAFATVVPEPNVLVLICAAVAGLAASLPRRIAR